MQSNSVFNHGDLDIFFCIFLICSCHQEGPGMNSLALLNEYLELSFYNGQENLESITYIPSSPPLQYTHSGLPTMICLITNIQLRRTKIQRKYWLGFIDLFSWIFCFSSHLYFFSTVIDSGLMITPVSHLKVLTDLEKDESWNKLQYFYRINSELFQLVLFSSSFFSLKLLIWPIRHITHHYEYIVSLPQILA